MCLRATSWFSHSPSQLDYLAAQTHEAELAASFLEADSAIELAKLGGGEKTNRAAVVKSDSVRAGAGRSRHELT